MQYEVRVGFPTDAQKRIKFKHRAELGGSNITKVMNDFMDLFIEKEIKPEDIKKLIVK